MGRASRAKRERRTSYEAQRRRWCSLDAAHVAAVTLVVAVALAAAVVAVVWWADARVGPEGVYLGFVFGRSQPGVSGITVPDGALALAALGLTAVPVVLAALGIVSTRRSPVRQPSRLTGAAALAAVAVGPAVAGTSVATAVAGADSGWVDAVQFWPIVAVVVGLFGVGDVTDRIRRPRPAPTRR